MISKEGYNGSIQLILDKRSGEKGECYIAKQYYKLPLQVMTPFYQDDDGTVFVYLLNPSGGILEYDNLLVDVEVKDGAKAVVTTPSANKVYKRKSDGTARQINSFKVGSGSVLEFCPDEIIPYKDSSYSQLNEFYLEKNSKLITWDILSAGRIARGESFQFARYQSLTKIYVDNVPILIDNIDVKPDEINVVNMQAMDGFQFLATIYVYAENCSEELTQEIRNHSKGDMFIGASMISSNLISVKMMSSHAYEIIDEVNKIWGVIRKGILGKDGVRIRKH